MKIADVRRRVLEAALNQAGSDIDRELVALVVNLSVEAVGFHLAADGEICDPRPKSTFTPPSAANWRHRRPR